MVILELESENWRVLLIVQAIPSHKAKGKVLVKTVLANRRGHNILEANNVCSVKQYNRRKPEYYIPPTYQTKNQEPDSLSWLVIFSETILLKKSNS